MSIKHHQSYNYKAFNNLNTAFTNPYSTQTSFIIPIVQYKLCAKIVIAPVVHYTVCNKPCTTLYGL